MLEPVIEKAMVPQRVALIFGARRVGKTILLENILKQVKGNVLLLNGDDADTLRLLEERSIANYRRLLHGVDVLAIDEAQQIPIQYLQPFIKALKILVEEYNVTVVFCTATQPNLDSKKDCRNKFFVFDGIDKMTNIIKKPENLFFKIERLEFLLQEQEMC